MQILPSGSFINIENQGKIEQLIYTARELANAASQTEGFVSTGESNQRLALEMWQGADYMCRDHEEATIKNIFLSNFLARLRAANRAASVRPTIVEMARFEGAAPPSPPPDVVHAGISAPGSLSTSGAADENRRDPAGADEYLGVVSSEGNDDVATRTNAYADKYVPNSKSEIGEPDIDLGNGLDDISVMKSEDSILPETAAAFLSTSEVQTSTAPVETALEPNKTNTLAQNTVAAIVLADKEPYTIENCTVTVVIQLLPEEAGTRKCIVSIRTHDFSPQIAVAELNSASFVHDLVTTFGHALERYKAELPVKVTDKLKKEKSASRKQSAKVPDKPKGSKVSATGDESKNAAVPESAVTQTDGTANNQQASLFGG